MVVSTGTDYLRHSFAREYKQIGEVLLICESSFLTIGIPWLAPTTRVELLRKKIDCSILEFVKINLVNIPTSVLKLYSEDLPKENSKKLNIEIHSNFERYAHIYLSAGIYTALAVSLSLSLSKTRLVSLILMIGILEAVVLVVLFVILINLSSDSYRKKTFKKVILKELSRREGHNSNGIKILTAKPDPC